MIRISITACTILLLLHLGQVHTRFPEMQPIPADGAAGSGTKSDGAPETSPMATFRDEQYRNAIRGLTYTTGFVELGTDAPEVLAQAQLNEDTDTFLARGAEQLGQNRVIEALETYTLAVLSDPADARAYEGLGLSFGAKGKTENAIASFRSALRFDPTLTETRYYLGVALSMQGNLQEAVDTWQQLVELNSTHAKAHERLAIALYYLHDYEGSWGHVHAAEALEHQVPPQFRSLLEAQMSEP